VRAIASLEALSLAATSPSRPAKMRAPQGEVVA
jgi:hypothetical protein